VYVAGETEPPEPAEALLLANTSAPELPGYEYRLACLCRLRGEVSVIVSSISDVVVADVGMDAASYDGDEPSSLGLAIDIGTTTVTALLFRLGDRERLATVSEFNHQVVHGADVLSRIDVANRLGSAVLQGLIVEQLNDMVGEALTQAPAAAGDITRVVITGNTTMLHFLCGLPVETLGVFPFTPVSLFGEAMPAERYLPGLRRAELYLPPGISTYVGPDITCGLLATGMGAMAPTKLLVDLGTNGEMALGAGGRLWCCATAAGPAFEGAEISSGMPALPGAIDDVFVENGGVGYTTVGHKRPKGVCGTGLIAAVDSWLALGVVSGSGAMAEPFVRIGTSDISLTQADVRKLQLAKAAVAAGIETLLAEAAVGLSDVTCLHLAGGFGSYLQPAPAAGIGLIPQELATRVDPAGNTALSGAVLLTLSKEARRLAEKIAGDATEVQLSTHPVFMDRYIEDMAFREDD